jgi:hypothetical protein
MRLFPAVMTLVSFACLAGGTSAQVVGVVVDSAGAPVPEVLVFVDQGPGYVTTDAAGGFRLDSVNTGAHVLSFRRDGFAPRSFGLTVVAGAAERNVGSVRLTSGAMPVANLTGRVVQEIDGQPLADAAITVNGTIVARTDGFGTFTVASAAVRWGPNDVVITHSGVNQTVAADQFWISSPDEMVELDVSMDIAPIALPGVSVEATGPRSERLQTRGFYQRQQASSNAVFFTADDIRARSAKDWEDLLRGVRFTRTRAYTSLGGAGDPITPPGGTTGGLPGGGGGPGRDAAAAAIAAREGQCSSDTDPIAFLDGTYVGTLSQLTRTVRVETIEGLEIYRGVASLPIEFNRLGAECGVVVVWSIGAF